MDVCQAKRLEVSLMLRRPSFSTYASAALLVLTACSSSKGESTPLVVLPGSPDAGVVHFPHSDSGVVFPTKKDGGTFLPDVGVLPPATKFGCQSDANCSGGEHCDARKGSITEGQCVTCLESSQCTNSQVCSPASGGCVFDCRLPSSPSCQGTDLPFCDMSSGACVACQSDSDCMGATTGPLCNTTNHACVECKSLSDCGGATPQGCSNGQCGRCLGTSDCAPNQDCVPDNGTGATFSPGSCMCANNGGCPSSQPVCLKGPLESNGKDGCGCMADSDCSGGYHCDTLETDQCVPPCTTNDDCNDFNYPVCDTASGRCIVCQQSSDCDDQLCNPATHTCVSCLSITDCEDGMVCTSMNVCGSCTSSSDCAASPSGSVCTPSGTCGCSTSNDCNDPATLDAGASYCEPVGDAGYCTSF